MMWIDSQSQIRVTCGQYRLWTSYTVMHMPRPLALVAYWGLHTESFGI